MKLFSSVDSVAALSAQTPVAELAAPFVKEELVAAFAKADILKLYAAEMVPFTEVFFGESTVAGRAIVLLYAYFQNLKAILLESADGTVYGYNTVNGAYTRCDGEESARLSAI